MALSRNQAALLVSGTATIFTLIREYKAQKARYDSTMNFNRLFDDFMDWYETNGQHLGINEFHREFKKHFQFVSVAKRAIR